MNCFTCSSGGEIAFTKKVRTGCRHENLLMKRRFYELLAISFIYWFTAFKAQCQTLKALKQNLPTMAFPQS